MKLRLGLRPKALALLETLAALGGYKARFTRPPSREGYEIILPNAMYAPWSSDRAFLEVYRKTEGKTLVDVYRCYELWQLVAQSVKVPGALLEVGVWRGGTTAIIAASAKANGIQDPVYACDTFAGVVKAGEKDSTYRGGEHADASESDVRRFLEGDLHLKNVRLLRGIFPEESGQTIADPYFRFCHIDVDVYNSARDILAWVWPRLSRGGMVVYDDYGFISTDGITALVNEQRRDRDRIVLHNLNGHAVVVKIAS